MSKFRKWLIKKLGGYTSQIKCTQPEITYRTNELIVITSQFEISEYDPKILNAPIDRVNEDIIQKLKYDLMKYIVPEYQMYRNIEKGTLVYRAKIYVSKTNSDRCITNK